MRSLIATGVFIAVKYVKSFGGEVDDSLRMRIYFAEQEIKLSFFPV